MGKKRLRKRVYVDIVVLIILFFVGVLFSSYYSYKINSLEHTIASLNLDNNKIMEENSLLENKIQILIDENSKLRAKWDKKEMQINDFLPKERNSPQDFLDDSRIVVFNNRVMFFIDEPILMKFTDTNSMDPVFDVEANGILIKPENTEGVKVGDIVSYNVGDKKVIHRVIKIDNDERGWYAILRGDNEELYNLNKIRFEDVHGVMVAIIY